MASLTRLPTSDDAVQWTPSAGSDNYAMVDDPIETPDDDTTYVSETTATQRDRYGYAAISLPAGASDFVIKLTVRGRKTGAGNSYVQPFLYVNGTVYAISPGNIFTTAYSDYTATWNTNPDTGSPWVQTDVEGSGPNPLTKIGIHYTAGTLPVAFRVTQLYLTVEYSVPSGNYGFII